VSKGRFSKSWGLRASVSFSPFSSPVTHFFALAPIFARLKNEKCLERAENLTETLATQASVRAFCQMAILGIIATISATLKTESE